MKLSAAFSELQSWYNEQTDAYPTEEEIDEMRQEYEAQEAAREARGERRLADIPDEEIPF